MKLQDAVMLQKDALLRSLQESIRIRSVEDTPSETAPYGKGVSDCLEHALNTAKSLGFTTVNMDHQMGWCEYGEGEEMVAVLGHLDVVPEGEGWSFNPFGGEIRDGKVLGRGSVDDKGPTIAAMYALAALRDTKLPLSRRIRILFGTNEETGSNDMKYYTSHGGEIPVMGFTPDGEYPVINGEKGIINADFQASYSQTGPVILTSIFGGDAPNVVPASAGATISCSPETAADLINVLEPMQKDSVTCTLTDQGIQINTVGVSAHGAFPELGVNAIGLLLAALDLLPLSEPLASQIHFLSEKIGLESDGTSLGIALCDEPSGKLTFNMGTIQGDETTFKVRFNYRYPVTEVYDHCAPIVNQAFADAGFTQTRETHKACLYLPEDSALVQTLMRVYTEQTGLPAVAKSIGGGTYAKTIPNVVAFGPIFPGEEVREHKPDEFIEIDMLMKNTQIMAEALYQLAK